MKETFFAGCVWSVQDFHGQAGFNFEWRISFEKILFNSRHVADSDIFGPMHLPILFVQRLFRTPFKKPTMIEALLLLHNLS